MPNIKSAKKELRKSVKRALHNKKIKDNLKNLAKKAKKAIISKNKNAKELTDKTLKSYDKAAQKGVINDNACDRKKSRLHNKLNKNL
ncbi:MAG: 30S ribosomal protein S20 [Patescibacteria group bacterium]|nr:30S ribosomal protein S20 [Patescibacteria group bacterium]